MIFEDSRYATARVMPVADNTGVYHATVIPYPPQPVTGDYTVHRVVYGDRLDLIAFRAYGDPELWWRIADANPEIAFPDDLAVNTLIRVPRVSVNV